MCFADLHRCHHSEHPETEWFEFRQLWLENGGDDVYACWKLSYDEDLFQSEELRGYETWQDYSSSGLCPVAEYLQVRIQPLVLASIGKSGSDDLHN